MGGHGGLNILPQKRWNVYNRENRFKVAQDEAKAKEAEDAEEERHQQAEREYRHQALLQRARKQAGGAAELAAPGTQTPLAIGAAPADVEAPAQLLQGPYEHINFWKDEETSNAKAQHPEVEAAKLEEARKRGKAEFYTTDPKFDERFKLGYQMAGDKPWYAKKPVVVAPDVVEEDPLFQGNKALSKQMGQDSVVSIRGAPQLANEPATAIQGGNLPGPQLLQPPLQGVAHTAINERAQKGLGVCHSSGSRSSSGSSSEETSSSSSSSDSDRSGGRRHKRRTSSSSGSKKKAYKKRSSRHKHKSKDKERSRKRSSSKHRKERKVDKRVQEQLKAVKKPRLSIDQLRSERLAREAVERDKARLTLMGALDGGASQPVQQGYNSGYGFAAMVKKQRLR